jgi:hypothetical protein
MTIQISWPTRDSLSVAGGKDFLYVIIGLGAEVALINIMQDPTILNNVQLDITDLSFPSNAFVPDVTESVFAANMNSLGVAMFGVSADDVAIGVMETEAKLGFLLPKVFPNCGGT